MVATYIHVAQNLLMSEITGLEENILFENDCMWYTWRCMYMYNEIMRVMFFPAIVAIFKQFLKHTFSHEGWAHSEQLVSERKAHGEWTVSERWTELSERLWMVNGERTQNATAAQTIAKGERFVRNTSEISPDSLSYLNKNTCWIFSCVFFFIQTFARTVAFNLMLLNLVKHWNKIRTKIIIMMYEM